MNPCPIEYRNIYIKELDPGAVEVPAKPRGKAAEAGTPLKSAQAELLSRIEAHELPQGYDPAKHQEYVDRRLAGLSEAQRGAISNLWNEKQRIDPEMPNRGASFVKILEYVAADSQQQQKPKSTNNPTTRDNTDKESLGTPSRAVDLPPGIAALGKADGRRVDSSRGPGAGPIPPSAARFPVGIASRIQFCLFAHLQHPSPPSSERRGLGDLIGRWLSRCVD